MINLLKITLSNNKVYFVSLELNDLKKLIRENNTFIVLDIIHSYDGQIQMIDNKPVYEQYGLTINKNHISTIEKYW